MRSPVATFAAAAFAATLFPLSAAAELRLGIDAAPSPPFYEADPSGEVSGWEIEIGEAVCAEMGEECEWVGIAWDGLIPALGANKIDAIFGSMSITEERMKTIDFSQKYYNTPAAIVAATSSDVSGDPASVAGKIVGVQVATTHQNYVQANYEGTADQVKTYQNFDEHNQDLVSGRVDAVVGDSLAFETFLGSPEGADFEIKDMLVDASIFGEGVGAGVRKGDDELRERFNQAITAIRENGTYDEISAKYFDFDIFGGN